MNEFKEIGLSDKLLRNLEVMNITEPTEIQRKTIPLTLQGKDVIGGSSTGSGKTLAFAASIVENMQNTSETKALVLTPTRELAEQVSEAIKDISRDHPVNVLSIYGGVSIENQINKIPKANIIVGTPGRVLDHLNRKTLDLSNVEHVVLDEVDKMFEMGFQEDVEKIIKPCPKNRQTLMFSATLSDELDYLSRKYSKNPEKIQAESLVDPSKLRQIFYDVQPKLKFSLLVHLLKQEESGGVMVFCNTRKNVEFIANNLELNGINTQPIHGGLSQNKRKEALDNFHKGKVKVLVCTDVAARGLDIRGVTHIYNQDSPPNSKEYIHRIGRTARAGEEGIAINIVSQRDYPNFREVKADETLNIEQVKLPYIPQAKMKFPNQDKKKGFRGRDRENNKGRDNRRNKGEGRNGNKNNFGRKKFNRGGGNRRFGRR